MLNFFKLQFANLSPFFWFALIFSIYGMSITTLYFGGSTLSIIAYALGLCFIFFVGQGRAIGEIFSLLTCFAFLALGVEKSYLEYIMRYLIYIPITLFGIYAWGRIQLRRQGEVTIRHLGKRGVGIAVGVILAGGLVYGAILRYLDYSLAFITAFSVVMQFVAYFLQMQRYVENYLFFTIANLTTLGIWLTLFLLGQAGLEPLFMMLTILTMGVFFYFRWRREAAGAR